MSDRFSMKGRRALITGASRSIGRAITLGFAEQGADVAVNCVPALDAQFGNERAGEAVCEEARSHGVKAVLAPGDMTHPDVVRTVFDTTVQGLGGVDVLVVCASVQYEVPLQEVTHEQFQHQVDLNFRTTVDLLQLTLPPMKERGWGRILMIGSVQQVRPHPLMPVYAALKSAQHNLANYVAKEYAEFGITANNLAPGLVDTDRNQAVRADPARWKAAEEWATPMKRAASPDEMVGAAILMCSDAGSYINGANLEVSGGGHMPR